MPGKPLSKETGQRLRERLERFRKMVYVAQDYLFMTPGDVEDMLAAEQFWRESVKNSTPDPWLTPTRTTGEKFCFWCIAYKSEGHKPDCPWLLAQEEDRKGEQ